VWDDIYGERQSRMAWKEKISQFLADLKRQDGLLTEYDEFSL